MSQGRSFGISVACWATLVGSTFAAGPDVNVRRTELWTNFFAGKPARMAFEVSSSQAGRAILLWSLSLSDGVIARGEKLITLNAERDVEVSWEIDLPDVKPGLMASGNLQLGVRPQDGSLPFETVEKKIALSICSPDVTSLRAEWLKSLDIVLFDPSQRTADIFERSKLLSRVADAPECADLTKGLILYGEGLAAVHRSAAWNAAIAAAASGRRVLVMSSPGTNVPIDGLLASRTDSIRSISFKRRDVIFELDKRLDAIAWPKPGRLVASSLHWSVSGEHPTLEIRDDADGWPFLDVHYRNGGRLICLGFGIIESWDATPAPRNLFLNVLEVLANDKPLLE